MISLKFDGRQFMKDINNIIEYSAGFVDGVELGKKEFLNNLGNAIEDMAGNFIDTMAKVDPQQLHHVYEWYRVGSPDARLFDIKYSVSNLGLSFTSIFRQSETIKDGSREPFYNKAQVMESGQSVTIAPRNSTVLAFDVDGQTIFTKGPITINNPGGNVQGQYSNIFDMFFSKYFSQSFLRVSGLYDYFNNPLVYKQDLRKGKASGRSQGVTTGYRWVVNAKVNK
jgi:hypothetical protein